MVRPGRWMAAQAGALFKTKVVPACGIGLRSANMLLLCTILIHDLGATSVG